MDPEPRHTPLHFWGTQKIYIDKITREKANGATVNIPIHPARVEIIKLKLDKDRKALLETRRRRVPTAEHPESVLDSWKRKNKKKTPESGASAAKPAAKPQGGKKAAKAKKGAEAVAMQDVD